MVSASTPASLAETASATLFVALELSRSTWRVALHAPLTNKVSQHRLDGGDADGLLALITRKRSQAEEKLGRPVRVVCCFEAGYDGFWLHRWLYARGIENRVLDAASLLVNRRARRAKTDRLDAAGLLRTLMALERGEAQVCRVVRVPTPEQEDARRRSRERARLVVERGQHTSRIKGLLMTQGIRDFEPTRRDWPARFEALRTPDGLPLAPCLRAELLRACRRAAGRNAPSHQGHRQGRRSWSSDRHASGRWPGSGSPLCAARLWVGGDDGAVDQSVFEVRLIGQSLKDAREDAALHPAAKSLEDAVPVAEIARQVAPGHARSHAPQHRLKDQPIVFGRRPRIGGLAGQQRGDLLPDRVPHHEPRPLQHRPNPAKAALEA